MSLDWNEGSVQNWQALQADELERSITDVIIWQMLCVGLAEITAEKVDEWLVRLRISDAVFGSPAGVLEQPGGPSRQICRSDIARRVGLRTNADVLTSAGFFG